VVQIIGTYDVKQYSVEDPKLVLEYCNLRNLTQWRQSQQAINTNNKVKMLAKYVGIMKQVFTGLEFIHANKIVHGDIKPDNLLLKGDSNNPTVKIADFGGAQLLGSSTSNDPTTTPIYSSPEYLKSFELAEPHDIWSTGCVAYYVFNKKNLFKGRYDLIPLMQKNFSNSTQAQNLLDNTSEDHAFLVLSCLQFNSNNRPSATKMREHCDKLLSVESIAVSVEHNKCSCTVM
jgi:serine/threonine protein kinase